MLVDFAEDAELTAVRLDTPEGRDVEPFTWRRGGDHASGFSGVYIVSAEYPIPALGGEAQLRFEWITEQGEVAPEAEILLQLVADAVDARIRQPERAREARQSGHLRPI